MKCSKSFALLAVLIAGSLCLQQFQTGNQILRQTLSAAIEEFLTDNNSTNSFNQVFNKWFPGIPFQKPHLCSDGWPSRDSFTGTMQSILDRGFLLLGAPIPPGGTYPKRFNYTQVGNNPYGTLAGLEPDIAQALVNRINIHYNLSPPLTTYWYPQPWNAAPNNSVIYALNQGNFDVILASMSINATWSVDANTTVPRTSLIDFTCPYQVGSDAAIKGPKPLPNGAQPITNEASLNQTGLVVCVHQGTTGAAYAVNVLTATTVLQMPNGPDIVTSTVNQTCHYYVTTDLSGAQDVVNYPNLTYVTNVDDPDEFGIGIRKDVSSSTMLTVSWLLVILFAAFLLL